MKCGFLGLILFQILIITYKIDIQDVEKYFPDLIRATRHWFKIYKIPDGKPANEFAFHGQCKDRGYAETIVNETHEAWKKLITGKIPCKADTHDISV